ncbi:cyclin-F [Lingula anatina]|uniref:Cyclin-F n=1 Tax=Lingula anatina TaxID=7574 RepID=A0A1S3JG58_LINAN|nr:cyclin-F [Lingula anatina]|eukprot:XP_013409126.1 cyclin-F [Lingula anatina]
MKVVKEFGKCKLVLQRHMRSMSLNMASQKPRTRSDCTIWSLPEEILLLLLQGLHIKDLLNMAAVHSYFRDLIYSHTSLWAGINFDETWPSIPNLKHFERSASSGNIEALIKLGVAYLYNEGFPGDFEGKRITSNGEQAAAMFCQVESLTPEISPFTWLFIRPPWSTAGACCKEYVFKNMKSICEKDPSCKVQLCLAHTLQLFDDEEHAQEAKDYLEKAASQHSPVAAYQLWQCNQKTKAFDVASQLKSIRMLRDIANKGQLEAQLSLCHLYADGKYGGISEAQAAGFMKEFVQSTKPSDIHDIFRWNYDITNSMRYILVDWLVEVASMKDFSSLTLHVAISVVDRFISRHMMTKSKLQLLGVAAMVVCSRYLGKDIITIREAAWLTDNTYKYEDVVRMMGEILATLKGDLRVVTIFDLVGLLGRIVDLDQRVQCLAEYICELTLLHTDLSSYTKAEVAASCVLLARVANKLDTPWPSKMTEFTGFSVEDLTKCTIHIHEKCFMEGSLVDHREVKLQAVKQRYTEEKFYKISEFEMMGCDELCAVLGVDEHLFIGRELRIRFKTTKDLIMSPSRNKHRVQGRPCKAPIDADREKAATPTFEEASGLLDYFNESGMSGYFGDKEDEGDSYMDVEDPDDPDLMSLFCPDTFGTNDNQAMSSFVHFSDLSAIRSSSPSSTSSEPQSGKASRAFQPILVGGEVTDRVTVRRRGSPSYAFSIEDVASSSNFSLADVSIESGDSSHSVNHSSCREAGKHMAVASPSAALKLSDSVFDSGVSFTSQSGFTVHQDDSTAGDVQGASGFHHYDTRSQRQRRLSSHAQTDHVQHIPDRSALRTLSNQMDVTVTQNENRKGSEKRKSPQNMGNENKTYVMSF